MVDELDENYIEVIVYAIPDNRSFMFAQDSEYKQYFLHKDKSDAYTSELWNTIVVGSKLYILPAENKYEGKTVPALDVRMPNK